jgi:glycosyltransferase involved in cell wall biosynthesis
MRVLHIITGLDDGGAEAVLFRMCKLDKKYQHVVISLQAKQKYESLLQKFNISVHTLNFSNSSINFFGLFKLFKLIRQIKPDVVQTWMPHADLIGGVIARIAGIKKIFWGVHHANLIKGKINRLVIMIVRFNALLSNIVPTKIIYCAEKSREVQESIGFKKSKGVVVHNGYDTNSFFQDSSLDHVIRNELGISHESFLIGHVGNYHPLKDQETLIKSLRYLDEKNINFNAILVGNKLEPSNKNLVTLISDNGLTERIHLLGIRNDITTIMNGIDIFMLSSISEAFPNVLNEAMACETPCIATDVGDASLIVGDTGWIVNPQDAKALAKASIKALEEKKLRYESWEQRKKACRKRILENYSLEKMINKYKDVWAHEI